MKFYVYPYPILFQSSLEFLRNTKIKSHKYIDGIKKSKYIEI